MGGVSIWHWLIVLVLFVPWIWACGSELPIRALRWALAARIELRWERKSARSASIRDWPYPLELDWASYVVSASATIQVVACTEKLAGASSSGCGNSTQGTVATGCRASARFAELHRVQRGVRCTLSSSHSFGLR